MGIDVSIWVNEKEVLSKIENDEFWDLMYHLDNISCIRYWRIAEIINNHITLDNIDKANINKWIIKKGEDNLKNKKNWLIDSILYIHKNLPTFIFIPDISEYKGKKNLVEFFELQNELMDRLKE